MKCVEADPYYLRGLVGADLAWGGSFSPDPPHTGDPASQQILLSHRSLPVSVTQSASWYGKFQGTLCRNVVFTVHLVNPDGAGFERVYATVKAGKYVIGGATWSGLPSSGEYTGTVALRCGGDFCDAAAAAGVLTVEVSPGSRLNPHVASGTVVYGSTEFPSRFTVSTLQPCEVDDPHPDCVEAGFADLADGVRAFAAIGDVTADGETQLLAALDQAETAYGDGDGDNAQAVARLEEFQQLAADPALVPSEPARDTLTTSASGLITALEASGPT